MSSCSKHDENVRIYSEEVKKQSEVWDVFLKSTRSVEKRLASLYSNKNYVDITFVIDDNEETQKVGAHKLILGLGSPVFEAMFFGEMADSRNEIMLSDVSSKAFDNVMRFLYLDVTDFSDIRSTIDTVYAARKYLITNLEKECVSYLISKLDPRNVCQIYELASLFEIKDLIESCVTLIKEEPDLVFASEGFTSAYESTIKKLISFIDSKISPNKIFEAIHLWGISECSRMDKKPNQKNIRSTVLSLLPCINFLQMDPKHFVSDVVETGILTPEEVGYILSHLIDPFVKYPFEWPSAFSLH